MEEIEEAELMGLEVCCGSDEGDVDWFEARWTVW